jgi:hypothetical protein
MSRGTSIWLGVGRVISLMTIETISSLFTNSFNGFEPVGCVLYGKSEVEVEVPDDSTVIEPQNIEALEDIRHFDFNFGFPI